MDNLIIEHLEVRSENDPDVKQYTHLKMLEVRSVKMPKEIHKIRAKFHEMMLLPVVNLVNKGILYEKDPKRVNGHTLMMAREHVCFNHVFFPRKYLNPIVLSFYSLFLYCI